MFLVDTNVWLELLLEQEKADEVRQFLQGIEARRLSITEFSLYSIGIILTRLNSTLAIFTWQEGGYPLR
jgi:predicted nucleic acid-binding protein